MAFSRSWCRGSDVARDASFDRVSQCLRSTNAAATLLWRLPGPLWVRTRPFPPLLAASVVYPQSTQHHGMNDLIALRVPGERTTFHLSQPITSRVRGALWLEPARRSNRAHGPHQLTRDGLALKRGVKERHTLAACFSCTSCRIAAPAIPRDTTRNPRRGPATTASPRAWPCQSISRIVMREFHGAGIRLPISQPHPPDEAAPMRRPLPRL